VGVVEFAEAGANGVGAFAGDAGEVGDAASAVLLGEEAEEEATGAFIGGGDEAVEGAMLSGRAAAGVQPTSRTGAGVDASWVMVFGHRPCLLGRQQQRGKVIVVRKQATYFCTAPKSRNQSLRIFHAV
jgi:hypothetical protein